MLNMIDEEDAKTLDGEMYRAGRRSMAKEIWQQANRSESQAEFLAWLETLIELEGVV